MTKENDPKLLDHNYDGIQELDNPLPSWWLAAFYGCIIVGIGYFAYFHLSNKATLRAQYQEALSHHLTIKDAYLENLSQFEQEKFDQIITQKEMVDYGKSVFTSNCVACHAANGAGDIGPNLSDDYWLFSDGSPSGIFPFIITGNPAAGMPAWGEFLEEDELYAVLAYIISIRGIKQDHPKEPQGDFFEAKLASP